MELRDRGRGLVQIKDDGTHAILPATRTQVGAADRVGLPVMWLRHAYGKMRRDGSICSKSAANYPVAERGGLHGAPELDCVVTWRARACIRGPCRSKAEKRTWLQCRSHLDRLGRQDKSRSLRLGRTGEECSDIRQLSRGATAHDSLPIRATPCNCTAARTSPATVP